MTTQASPLSAGWAKTELFLRVDNFATVRCRKEYDMSKVFKFCLKIDKTKMSVKLNIPCIVCINIQYVRNYADFDNNS